MTVKAKENAELKKLMDWHLHQAAECRKGGGQALAEVREDHRPAWGRKPVHDDRGEERDGNSRGNAGAAIGGRGHVGVEAAR